MFYEKVQFTNERHQKDAEQRRTSWSHRRLQLRLRHQTCPEISGRTNTPAAATVSDFQSPLIPVNPAKISQVTKWLLSDKWVTKNDRKIPKQIQNRRRTRRLFKLDLVINRQFQSRFKNQNWRYNII
jgi:hypothetical protein